MYFICSANSTIYYYNIILFISIFQLISQVNNEASHKPGDIIIIANRYGLVYCMHTSYDPYTDLEVKISKETKLHFARQTTTCCIKHIFPMLTNKWEYKYCKLNNRCWTLRATCLNRST